MNSIEVLELAVDAGEAHVGDGIEVAERLDDLFADHLRLDLLVAGVHQIALEGLDQPLHRLGGDRPLHDRAPQAREDLHPVPRLATTVALHHQGHHLLDALVRRVATAASIAFTSPAGHLATLGEAGVDHLVVQDTAVRALHGAATYHIRVRRSAAIAAIRPLAQRFFCSRTTVSRWAVSGNMSKASACTAS